MRRRRQALVESDPPCRDRERDDHRHDDRGTEQPDERRRETTRRRRFGHSELHPQREERVRPGRHGRRAVGLLQQAEGTELCRRSGNGRRLKSRACRSARRRRPRARDSRARRRSSPAAHREAGSAGRSARRPAGRVRAAAGSRSRRARRGTRCRPHGSGRGETCAAAAVPPAIGGGRRAPPPATRAVFRVQCLKQSRLRRGYCWMSASWCVTASAVTSCICWLMIAV